jgi:hypothetical protein
MYIRHLYKIFTLSVFDTEIDLQKTFKPLETKKNARNRGICFPINNEVNASHKIITTFLQIQRLVK